MKLRRKLFLRYPANRQAEEDKNVTSLAEVKRVGATELLLAST